MALSGPVTFFYRCDRVSRVFVVCNTCQVSLSCTCIAMARAVHQTASVVGARRRRGWGSFTRGFRQRGRKQRRWDAGWIERSLVHAQQVSMGARPRGCVWVRRRMMCTCFGALAAGAGARRCAGLRDVSAPSPPVERESVEREGESVLPDTTGSKSRYNMMRRGACGAGPLLQ